MYECFHCLSRSVIWDSDFTFEDMGYDGEILYSISAPQLAQWQM